MRVYFSRVSRLFFYTTLLIGLLVCNPLAIADDIKQHGDAYVIYLPENLDYLDVVDRLKSEILAQNWEITDVQDIDIGMRQYGKSTQNKVISVCRSQLLAQAITEDPFVSLIIPCRFTAFRETVKKKLEKKLRAESCLGLLIPPQRQKRLTLSSTKQQNKLRMNSKEYCRQWRIFIKNNLKSTFVDTRMCLFLDWCIIGYQPDSAVISDSEELASPKLEFRTTIEPKCLASLHRSVDRWPIYPQNWCRPSLYPR